jgi:adenylosuccinate lyase
MSTLSNISPVDGRYAAQVDDLRDIFSESGLIRLRVQTEVAWLKKLTLCKELPELEPNTRILSHLESLVENWCEEFSLAIKEIEQGTNHDVKAIEYWLKEQLLRFSEDETKVYREFIHFACTSEDINNVAYALMLKQARDHVILPEMNKIVSWLKQHARAFAEMPMMSRTHGQPASPTTMGKELAIFASRLSRQIRQLEEIPILAKINGAVGNFNAHLVAYPQIDWLNLSRELIEELGLDFNKYTTQIESHDYIAEICDVMVRFNHILLDLDRDLWSYISLGYFKQLRFQGEVGYVLGFLNFPLTQD